MIMHTRNDDLVSVSHSERLYDWSNQPNELLISERRDHNTILAVNQDAYFSALDDLKRHTDVSCQKRP